MTFYQESGEIQRRHPNPHHVKNINAVDEAWFLRLPTEEMERIKAIVVVDIGKRVQCSSMQTVKCTVCEKPLDLHKREDLHR